MVLAAPSFLYIEPESSTLRQLTRMASFASVFVRQSCYSRIMSLQTSFRQATIRNVVARSPRQGIHATAGPGRPSFYKAFGVAGVGLGLAAVAMPTVYCDGNWPILNSLRELALLTDIFNGSL